MGPPKILEIRPRLDALHRSPAARRHHGDRARRSSTPPPPPAGTRTTTASIAIGPDDPANGIYRGESLPSSCNRPTACRRTPQLIDSLSQPAAGARRWLMSSPTCRSPPARSEPVAGGAAAARIRPTTPRPHGAEHCCSSSAPDAIAVGAAPADPARTPSWPPPHPFPPPPHPPINRGPRSPAPRRTPGGTWTLYVLVPYAAPTPAPTRCA